MADKNIQDKTEKQAQAKAKRFENVSQEIDLLELFMQLLKHWVSILIVTCAGAIIAGIFSIYMIVPQYSSSSMMYIISKETTLTSLADLQIGSQLTNDYKYVITSRPVLEDVVNCLNLGMSYSQLSGKITVENPNNTRIIRLTVQDPDPVMAKEIVDTLADTAVEYIADTMEQSPPKIIESGVVATHKTSPSHSKNIMIGAMLAFVVICGIYTIQFLMDDTIATTDDIDKYLGITVLASVPTRESAAQEKDDKAKYRKKKKLKRGVKA